MKHHFLCLLNPALGIQQQIPRMSLPALTAQCGLQSGGSEEQEPQGSQPQRLVKSFLVPSGLGISA